MSGSEKKILEDYDKQPGNMAVEKLRHYFRRILLSPLM